MPIYGITTSCGHRKTERGRRDTGMTDCLTWAPGQRNWCGTLVGRGVEHYGSVQGQLHRGGGGGC